jgi:energy-converting hydrogenase Eha subunit B
MIGTFRSVSQSRASLSTLHLTRRNAASTRISSPTGDNTMRPTIIISTVSLIIALVAIWNTNEIIANPGKAGFVASPSMDVMQMMKDMKDLPEQQFDAF